MSRPTVFIVDDDAAVRDSLSLLLSLRGYPTAVFGCAEDFLKVVSPDWCGCVVADIRMPGMNGLALQATLRERAPGMPVIIITAHGDIAAARQAFKASAVDFFEKPYDEDLLIAAVERGLERSASGGTAAESVARSPALSARERQVMELVVEGLDNRQVGDRLDISPRTVEVHKARLMAKLGARNLADLIRLAQLRR
jgi:two-component system, LuxR family, response regulator FixJ